MTRRHLLTALLALVPATAYAQQDDARARAIAQEILDKGAKIFDSRDAAAMAATYIDSAQIVLLKRDSEASTLEIVNGRAAIQKGYADIFKDRQPEHRARNTVDSARFLGPNLLLIEGRFALNIPDGDIVQFVQIRTRIGDGDPWRIATLQLTQMADKNP